MRYLGELGKNCKPEIVFDKIKIYLETHPAGSYCAIWECASFCGISQQTLHNRAREHEEIQDQLDEIANRRMFYFDFGAAENKVPSSYAIFVMKNLGLRDHQDINIGGQANALNIDMSQIGKDVIDKIYEHIAKSE